MFAFVIYDRETKILFGARDRFGIKPFYYQYNYKHFIFASDIPPILTNREFNIGPNKSVIFNYLLSNRTNYSEETFFNGVLKLRPGFKFKVINHELILEPWYNIEKQTTSIGFTNKGQLL